MLSLFQVNVPRLASAYLPEAAPWLQLCTRLSKLATGCISAEPATISVTEAGWIKGKRDLLERSVKIGCCVSTDKVNLINVQSRCKTSVKVVEGGEGDAVSVECEILKLTGSVCGGRPVLTQVGGQSVGMVELSGCVVITKGSTLSEIVQQLQGISEVSKWTFQLVCILWELLVDFVYASMAWIHVTKLRMLSFF